ncbi:hypothetical protein ABZ547_08390 [Streptomyces sparsogenes]|uniref:hypothetical protein n=1 Tax=Streptomyces sparsogenes TaxID=67365 RepID=UPI0033D08F66
MIREDRFLISRRPYAVDLSSLKVGEPTESGHYWAMVNAVWFRRHSRGHGDARRIVTVACTGTLRNLQGSKPVDARAFLAAYTDGRYGGDCQGRWDGENYWGAQKPEVIEQHLELLRPMLERYPAAPAGWDGWWRF